MPTDAFNSSRQQRTVIFVVHADATDASPGSSHEPEHSLNSCAGMVNQDRCDSLDLCLINQLHALFMILHPLGGPEHAPPGRARGFKCVLGSEE
jgi:hypothetical protein